MYYCKICGSNKTTKANIDYCKEHLQNKWLKQNSITLKPEKA